MKSHRYVSRKAAVSRTFWNWDGSKRLHLIPLEPHYAFGRSGKKYMRWEGKLLLKIACNEQELKIALRTSQLVRLFTAHASDEVMNFENEQSRLTVFPPNKGYATLTIFDHTKNDRTSISLWDQHLQEMRALLLPLIPAMHGVPHLSPQTSNESSLAKAAGVAFQRGDRRFLAVKFLPSQIHDGKLYFGQTPIGFYLPERFFHVHLTIQEIALICSHDFLSEPTLSLSKEETGLEIRLSSNWWFVKGFKQDEEPIMFRLGDDEFILMRTLFKSAIPVLTGFQTAFLS